MRINIIKRVVVAINERCDFNERVCLSVNKVACSVAITRMRVKRVIPRITLVYLRLCAVFTERIDVSTSGEMMVQKMSLIRSLLHFYVIRSWLGVGFFKQNGPAG